MSLDPQPLSRQQALRLVEGSYLAATTGLIWLALEANDDAHASVVRRYVDEVGGHATLFRAPSEIRQATSVFHPLEGAVAGITKRIKDAFDPNGILNPGRMYEGM